MDLLALVEQVVGGLNYELVDLETSSKGGLMRVFIDSPKGITVEDCATVSNQLTRLFEVEAVEYERLEVSSPGLDRPLKKLSDFERFVGVKIQLRAIVPLGNQRNFVGVIDSVRGSVVLLNTEKAQIEFPFEEIEKARLIPEF